MLYPLSPVGAGELGGFNAVLLLRGGTPFPAASKMTPEDLHPSPQDKQTYNNNNNNNTNNNNHNKQQTTTSRFKRARGRPQDEPKDGRERGYIDPDAQR
eukprot:6890086-Pyramimonas_sp.AAC.1